MSQLNILDTSNKINLESLKSYLDEEQFQAVTCSTKNTLCKANAGSGKTRVLTFRVAYLLAKGIPESEIMLLTFTKKASEEMLSRVNSLLNKPRTFITSGTFHSIGSRLLRKYAEAVGFTSDFTILDKFDSKSMLGKLRKAYLEKKGLDKELEKFPDKKMLSDLYSYAANFQIPIVDLAKERFFDDQIIDGVCDIAILYAKKKFETNTMDFDDLILNFRRILQYDIIRQEVNQKIKYILVDEYQDVNDIQRDIVMLLNQSNDHVFVVGDDAQSIYGWRGSNVDNILNFFKDFTNSQEFYIRYNYRSDGEILKLAESSINNNYPNSRDKKCILPFLPSSVKPVFKNYDSNSNQDYQIAWRIKALHKQGMPYSEMAILTRKNKLSFGLERALVEQNIPYKVFGVSFFERKHTKDILSLLSFIVNPKDETAFGRLLGLVPKVGEVTANKIIYFYRANGYKIKAFYLTAFQKVGISKIAKAELLALVGILVDCYEAETPAEVINTFMEGYYKAYLNRTDFEQEDRLQDIEFMEGIAEGFDSTQEFLEHMNLGEPNKDDGITDKVLISSVHKAKGLEWDCVFLPYLNDGLLPVPKADEEEERRIFYVAITRAKKKLYLSSIACFDYKHWEKLSISKFLFELPSDVYKVSH